jgi:hypothetical protein
VATIPLSFWLVLLRLELPPLRALDLLRVCGLRFAVEREPLLRARVEADDFERDEPPEARDAPLPDRPLAERGDRLAFVFEPEPFDALLLLCLLGEADLLVAICDTSPIENIRFLFCGVPVWEGNNPSVQGIAERIGWPPWPRSTTS